MGCLCPCSPLQSWALCTGGVTLWSNPIGPSPKRVHQTSENNDDQQKSVTKKAQLVFDNGKNILIEKTVGPPVKE